MSVDSLKSELLPFECFFSVSEVSVFRERRPADPDGLSRVDCKGSLVNTGHPDRDPAVTRATVTSSGGADPALQTVQACGSSYKCTFLFYKVDFQRK